MPPELLLLLGLLAPAAPEGARWCLHHGSDSICPGANEWVSLGGDPSDNLFVKGMPAHAGCVLIDERTGVWLFDYARCATGQHAVKEAKERLLACEHFEVAGREFQLVPGWVEIKDCEGVPERRAYLDHAAIFEDAREELRGYPFCEEDYEPELASDQQLCPLVDEEAAEHCPNEGGCPWTKPAREPTAIPWGALALGRFIPRILAAVAVLGFVFVLLLLLRRGLRQSKEQAFALEEAMDGPLLTLPKTPVEKLLEQAQAAEAAGQLARTAVLLHLASLKQLDQAGLIRFHASKTNREYSRAIKSKPELSTWFSGLVGEVERHQYGDGQVEPGRVRAALKEAARWLSRGALLILIAAGLSACAGGPSAASKEPSGLRALPAMLERAGFQVRRIGADDTLPEGTELVLYPGSVERADQARILSWMDADADIMFFQATPGEALSAPERVEAEDLQELEIARPPLEASFCELQLKNLRSEDFAGALIPNRERFLMPEDAVIEEEDPHTGEPARWRAFLFPQGAPDQAVLLVGTANEREGCMYMFAEPSLLYNASLARGPNARLVGALLHGLAPHDKIAIYDPEERLKSAPSLPPIDLPKLVLLSQAGLAVGALLLLLGTRFGPGRDPERFAHKRLVEHAAALGYHYHRAGPQGLAFAARKLARLSLARHQARPGEDIAAELARRHELPLAEVQAVLQLGALDPQAPTPPLADPARLLFVASRLLDKYSQEK